MKINHLRAVLFPAMFCALAAVVAVLATVARTDDAAPTLRARVTLSDVTGSTPAVTVVVRETNKVRGGTGENRTSVFKALRPDQPSPWFEIDAPTTKRYWPISVEARGVRAMRVTLEIENGAGANTVLQETVRGASALFWKYNDAATGRAVVIAASQVYREGWELARIVAVPENERPRRFIISDRLFGPGPAPQALDDGLRTLAALGINTAAFVTWGELSGEIAARARAVGINRFQGGIYAPPSLFGWDNDVMAPAIVDAWAKEQAAKLKETGLPPADVAVFHLADEPGWYFPSVTRQLSQNAGALENFRAFLRSKGLKPQDLGAAAWEAVLPVGASQVRDLPSRRLFYWTARYPTESSAEAFRVRTAALRRAFNPDLLVATNWNNWGSRFYKPSPNKKIFHNKDINADSAYGSLDWMNAGRVGAVSALWTEDWFADQEAQTWSYYADVLRSAARASDVAFGGFVIGRTVGALPAGARYKSLALIGHGAKAIEWRCYGPEARFPGNSYSNNRAAYGQIASANRMIGRAEDLLFPGRRAAARIAILMPGSAQIWDKSSVLPLYHREMNGLHYALTHSHYPVDFVDEDGIAAGELTKYDYQMLYVTAPNLAAAAQVALRDWMRAGGTAVFSPGAAVADEYDTPLDVLNEARGVRPAVLPRVAYNEELTTRTALVFDDARFGENATVTRHIAPLQTTTANALAKFADGGAALTSNRYGKGLALSYGFWPAINYLDSSDKGERGQLPSGWNEDLRRIVIAAPRVTRIIKPIELNTEVVEASRLDSAAGIAVTLLNWTNQPIGQLAVTIRDAGQVASVASVERGVLPFTRQGDSVRLTLPLRDVDVLMIRH